MCGMTCPGGVFFGPGTVHDLPLREASRQQACWSVCPSCGEVL